MTITTASPTPTHPPDRHAPDVTAILVAPNVSEQMGGEAIKALQIALELLAQGVRVHQITHDRVKGELDRKFPQITASYVRDSRFQRFLNRTKVLRPLLQLHFQWRAARLADAVARTVPNPIIHYTSPVSPVLPCFRSKAAPVVIGPLNGNIFYPPAFQARESPIDRCRRLSHPVAQFFHRLLFCGKQSADALLVASGERTMQSLRMAGCRDEQFVRSIDSGIPNRLGDLPRITHAGENLRFVHNGRLVDHKGADLVIKALLRTKRPCRLDVIGRGPQRARWIALAEELKLTDRVTFIEWIQDHAKVPEVMRAYRAFVFPSLAEANGIVVQEAMMYGLPVVCLNWGGPRLLVTADTGVLIDPRDEEHVVTELAKAMDALASDGELAERMSVAGRDRALAGKYLWKDTIRDWMTVHARVALRAAPPDAQRLLGK